MAQAEEKKYYIKVQGELIEVPKEIHLTYYRMDRRARFLNEKDEFHGTVLYSDLDNEEITGEEMVPDFDSEAVEEIAIRRVLNERVHDFLSKLTQSEQALIHALYFEGLSERRYAKMKNTPHMTVHDRKTRILEKLRKTLNS